MTQADLPGWAAALVLVLVLGGAGFALLGALGLVRFSSFYERVHAPTLGSTLGMAGVLAGSVVFFSVTEGRIVLREAVIGLFLVVTTPVSLMLLARAAAYRQRVEDDPDAPPEP